jgi:hypothetical protein
MGETKQTGFHGDTEANADPCMARPAAQKTSFS